VPAFADLVGNEAEQIKLVAELLNCISIMERQLVGLVVELVSRLNEGNGNEELLLHIFAPLLVEEKWLTYRKPPSIQLAEPFVV